MNTIVRGITSPFLCSLKNYKICNYVCIKENSTTHEGAWCPGDALTGPLMLLPGLA